MSLMTHLVELSEKHRSLERRIQAEQARPGVDPLQLRQLKREKLKIKDEMARLRANTH